MNLDDQQWPEGVTGVAVVDLWHCREQCVRWWEEGVFGRSGQCLKVVAVCKTHRLSVFKITFFFGRLQGGRRMIVNAPRPKKEIWLAVVGAILKDGPRLRRRPLTKKKEIWLAVVGPSLNDERCLRRCPLTKKREIWLAVVGGIFWMMGVVGWIGVE